jgi:hypothetical protein
MPEEAASWYAHIAEATEELQLELKRMEQANATRCSLAWQSEVTPAP